MKVQNLSYQHSKGALSFFKNLSFVLEKGKLHALHGKNGTGKSVLLNLLSGNSPPDSILRGLIETDGAVHLVNQRFDQMIADKFSFDDNLRFACMDPYPSFIKKFKTIREFPELIDRFHIDRTKPVYMLSGGQRQILALLMVLQKPIDILLLDEPTATLDEENAELVFEFLRFLAQNGMLLLVVCHDQDLVERYVTGHSLYMEKLVNGERRILLK